MTENKSEKRPIVSLILCSRNDNYMGNAMWRLATSINAVIANANELDRLKDLEIIVADWGSDLPLRNILNLLPEAENIVSFVYVPPEIAKVEQKDSEFPEVLALNAAVRKAEGDYIGRIDNDTVVGKAFLKKFFDLAEGKISCTFNPESAFLFAERKRVPKRLVSKSLHFQCIRWFINMFGWHLTVESATRFGLPFWHSPVGIMIFHRKIWLATHGYDERLLYWGWMEGDLALRLEQKHDIVDIKELAGNDFYHLEHYDPLTAFKDRFGGSATPRKGNPIVTENLTYTINTGDWGLNRYSLEKSSYSINDVEKWTDPTKISIKWKFIFPIILSYSFLQLSIDHIRIGWPDAVGNIKAKTRIFLGAAKKILFRSISDKNK